MEPIEATLKTNPNGSWAARHAAQARSWVMEDGHRKGFIACMVRTAMIVNVAKLKVPRNIDFTIAMTGQKKKHGATGRNMV